MGHIQARRKTADMDLDCQGHLDNFAGAAGDNTRLALEVGLKRQFRQNS